MRLKKLKNKTVASPYLGWRRRGVLEWIMRHATVRANFLIWIGFFIGIFIIARVSFATFIANFIRILVGTLKKNHHFKYNKEEIDKLWKFGWTVSEMARERWHPISTDRRRHFCILITNEMHTLEVLHCLYVRIQWSAIHLIVLRLRSTTLRISKQESASFTARWWKTSVSRNVAYSAI